MAIPLCNFFLLSTLFTFFIKMILIIISTEIAIQNKTWYNILNLLKKKNFILHPVSCDSKNAFKFSILWL